MKKLIVALVLLAIALVAGIFRLSLDDPHMDGLVLLILGAGIPGAWLLAVLVAEGFDHVTE